MKNIRILILTLATVGLLTFSSCGSDDSPSPEELATTNLLGTWVATQVILDNSDVTSPTYDNFEMTINNDLSYDTNGGTPAFTDTGGFMTFNSLSGNVISVTIDGVSATITLGADNTTAVLVFFASGQAIGARVSGINGDYTFSLQKQ